MNENMALTDYILNGNVTGSLAQKMTQAGWDIDRFRPFCSGEDGKITGPQYVSLKNKKVERVVANDATLTYDQWKHVDTELLKIQRLELGAWDAFSMRGLNYNVPGGWGKTLLLTQAMSDPGVANIGMDPVTRSMRDRPVRDVTNLPLPCIWSDFSYTLREIEEAAGSGMALDTTGLETATRRVLELREQLTIGTYGTYAFGGGTIYGLTNFSGRITGTLQDPTGGSWNPNKTVLDVLAMRQALYNQAFTGPFMLFVSLDWEQYLDEDYSPDKGDNTLRQRILANAQISGIQTLNWLPPKTFVLVSMKKETVRMIEVLPLRVIRWESQGGLEVNFKVVWGGAPQYRKTKSSQCGIAHYSYT